MKEYVELVEKLARERKEKELNERNFDGTGPEGKGPKTGRGMGPCKENEVEEEKKPSAGLSKKKKSAVAKKARAGKDIGKKGKGFEKVKKAAEKSGAEDPEAVAAAQMWKSIKR